MSMFYELMMKKKGIPSRYQEVEYIESTGTQYIDTGLVPKVTFKYKIKYSLNAIGNIILFGSRTSGAYNTSRNQIYLNSYFVNGVKKTILTNLYNTNDVNLNIDPAVNDVVETPLMQNENCVMENATQPIYLFALNNLGTVGVFSKAKMYYFQIYDNNSLIRNFIPVYDTETQKYGMWESVQGKFYGNDGTGDFGGSIVGYTIVGSPTIVDGVVSGFSSANYLTLPQPTFNTNDFEAQTSFIINSVTITRILAVGSASFSGIHLATSGKITGSFYNGSNRITIESSVATSINTKYYVKWFRKGTIIGISVSTDNINWTTDIQTISADTSIVINAQFYIGTNGAYLVNYFDGSIDLNNTYIKVNNKLYFNGQQA